MFLLIRSIRILIGYTLKKANKTEMEISDTYIIFLINNQRFALNLSKVERVVSIVKIIKLPKSPVFVLGAINFHGDFLPVISLYKLFLFPGVFRFRFPQNDNRNWRNINQ